MIDLSTVVGFEWDKGNKDKNWVLHRVAWFEAEEAFFHHPVLVYPDPQHSRAEERFYLLGQTATDRRLFVIFTIRERRIRIISVRDMSKKERKLYNEEAEKDF